MAINYKGYRDLLKELKRNPYQISDRLRMIQVISIIGEHPDAISIYQNLSIIDPDKIKALVAKGANGVAIAHVLLNDITLKTTSSNELMLKTYGYNKPINPAGLNETIDDVYMRFEGQYQTQRANEFEEHGNQETELALGELDEFQL